MRLPTDSCCLVQSERVEKLKRMSELQASVQQMRAKVKHLADNDPEILEEMGKAQSNRAA